MNAAELAKLTLASQARGSARYTGWVLMAALPMMIAGLMLPSLHLQNLWVMQQEYSLLSAVLAFWHRQYYSLFAVLLFFTVLFPTVKIVAGLLVFYLPFRRPEGLKRWAAPLSALSKWSMLDVFIVAVAVLALEGSLVTAASLGPGIALFAGSVLLSGWAYGRLTSLLVRQIEEKSE